MPNTTTPFPTAGAEYTGWSVSRRHATVPSDGLPTPTNARPEASTAGVDHTPSPGAQSGRTHIIQRSRPVAASRPNSRPGTSGLSPYGEATPAITRSAYATGVAHTFAFGGPFQSHS